MVRISLLVLLFCSVALADAPLNGTLYPKPATADQVRNIWAPRADKLGLGMMFNDAASGTPADGTALVRIGMTPVAPDPDRNAVAGVPTFQDRDDGTSTTAWVVDANTVGLDLSIADSYVSFCTSTGLAAPRGTIWIRASGLSTVANDYLISTASGSDGGWNIRATSATSLTLGVRIGGAAVNSVVNVTDLINTHDYLVTWGEKGFDLYIDWVLQDIDNSIEAYVGSAQFVSSNLGALAGTAPSSATFGGPILQGFAWWDWQLTADDMARLQIDPWQPFRPEALATEWKSGVGPIVCRPTTTTVTFSGVAGSAPAEGVMNIWYGTDTTLATTEAASLGTTPISTEGERYFQTITGLTAGTRYYYFPVWYDGETAWPFPSGRGTFKTASAAGATTVLSFVSDDHIGNSGLVAAAETTSIYVGDDIIASGLATAAKNAQWRLWRCLQDIESRQPDALFCMGDSAFGITSAAARWQGWREIYTPGIRAAPMFFVVGNHEGEAGYMQSDGITYPDAQLASQLLATANRKRYCPNPTNGEAEGVLTSEAADATAWQSNLSWIPSLGAGTNGLTGYLEDYVYEDTAGADITAKMGLNGGPLENYYSYTTGDVLVVVLDPYRYTTPGSAHGDGTFEDTPANWSYGGAQRAWAEKTLATNSALHKVIVTHQFPGGCLWNNGSNDIYYGRASGAQISLTRYGSSWGTATAFDSGTMGSGVAEEVWLHALARRTGANVVLGHDHVYSVYQREGVWYVHAGCPTSRFTTLDILYGDKEGQGLVGEYAYTGCSTYNTWPTYLELTSASGVLTAACRATSIPTVNVQNDINITWANFGWAGANIAAAAEATTLTLTETPYVVTRAVDEAAGAYVWTGSAWTAPDVTTDGAAWDLYDAPTDIGTTGLGYQWYDQPHVDATITISALDASTNGARVLYAPRTLSSTTLTARTAGTRHRNREVNSWPAQGGTHLDRRPGHAGTSGWHG
jgi:hypothetical protein